MTLRGVPFDSSPLLAGLGPLASASTAPARLRPAHVLYGGAHLWKVSTLGRAGEIARETLAEVAPDDASFGRVFGLPHALAGAVRAQVETKLARSPVDDYRIDFEDGYGVRSDDEEDAAAIAAARSVAALASGEAAPHSLPPFLGIRVRALAGRTARRSLRTIDRFFATWTELGLAALPATSFVITLPKVESPAEVRVLAESLAGHERALGWPPRTLGLEIMLETPRAFVDGGALSLPALVAAADDRCRGAHFGAYDFLSSLGVPAEAQDLSHPACVLARSLAKLSLAGTDVGLADGATLRLPLVRHRATPGASLDEGLRAENRAGLGEALAQHAGNVDRALREGYLQGWDLHPAQLVARWAAVFAFYARGRDGALARLRGFCDRAARATSLAGTFDDAASALGLVGFFVDGVALGAFLADDVERDLGVTLDVLARRDFGEIVAARAAT